MLKNIFCEVEYVGTDYFGFQVQNKKGKREITVQEVFETALERLFKEKIKIDYASRTDRGVHAKRQGVNFKVDTRIPLQNIERALNSFLPPDIRIKKIKGVPFDFHSRFWANSKIYRYVIFNRKNPSVFCQNFSWHIDKSLNLENAKRASKRLIGKYDFSLFAKEAKRYQSCIREIKDISFKKKNSFIYIDIEADGFLRHMARNIVSFLVKVAQEKISLKDIPLILERKISYTNKPAPARGLYLLKVKYAKG
ncbi:MAG: tRNA pseudouridine(38-40) synthase TruA [Candidatus Omnitrophota bacterium]